MTDAQYAFRAQKTSGLSEAPSWDATPKIPVDTTAVRCYAFSQDGAYFAYSTGTEVHLIPASSTSTAPSQTISQANVVALLFSPLSTWLFSFERPVKSDTDVHKNVRAWTVTTGEDAGGWYQKTQDDWIPIITPTETHLLRATPSDLLITTPPLSTRPSIRLKLDSPIRGLYLSNPRSSSTLTNPVKPHSEPSVAVWIGERKGAPANVGLYTLSTLLGKSEVKGGGEIVVRDMPISSARKAFYKADKLNVKWNPAGTMALFLTHSDVDATGKSYYGETNLYLVSVDGSFEGMVELDKDGPIYDFDWSPTSREFTVCYGYMPARTQMFDAKAKPIHSFGSNPRNFLAYQPQGRLLLSAGYGNLAGGVDIWDVSTRNKVAEFKAANSSHCEWSPCGSYILTATLSPRLRVDNGIKIWWCGGQLLHIQPQDDLYQASFRPISNTDIPAFPPTLPKAPEANASVALYRPKGEAKDGEPSKPAGAYRPPGARGTQASDVYRQRDESGPSSGTATPNSTPMFKGGKPSQRYVPGGGVPGAATPVNGANGEEKEKKKRVRSKRPLREHVEDVVEGVKDLVVGAVEAVSGGGGDAAVEVDEEDVTAKKVRNLNKKLKAIEELKDRQKSGEVLEKTQLKKIETESQVRKEIKALGG